MSPHPAHVCGVGLFSFYWLELPKGRDKILQKNLHFTIDPVRKSR